MMKKIYARDIPNYFGKKVSFCGWVHSVRLHGKISFLIIRDKTGSVQSILKKDILGEKYEKVKVLREESVIKVEGTVQEKKGGGYEILVENFEIISKSEPLPIEIWNPEVKTSFIKRVEYRFLDLRKPEIRKIFEVRSFITNMFREYLTGEEFVEIHTPKIVTIGAESGAEMFEVKYFDKKAYLSQSPQLYKQMLMASGIDKYFEISPYWRAEKSHTTKHLSEFWMLDVEIAWIDSYKDLIDLLKEMITYVLNKTKEKFDLNVNTNFKEITFEEVKNLLEREYNRTIEDDLDTESEKLIGKYFQEKGYDFVFITEFPWSSRPFYTMKKDEKYTYSFDLLFKGVEIVSGSQREHRYENLLKNMEEVGLDPKSFREYLEAFKYGMPPHGGFGLGLDRFVKQVLDLKDVREVVLWFRDPEHVKP